MIRLVSYAPGLSTAWVRSACAVWLFLMPGTALAQFEVKQPFVHQGEAELAYHGAYFEGTKESVVHGHEVEVLLGVTERFGIGLAGVLEQERGEDGKNNALKLTEIEAQAKLELIELKDDNGIGLALYSLYGTTTVGGSSENEFLFGPIVKAQRGKLSGTANFFAVSVNNIFEDGAKMARRSRIIGTTRSIGRLSINSPSGSRSVSKALVHLPTLETTYKRMHRTSIGLVRCCTSILEEKITTTMPWE